MSIFSDIFPSLKNPTKLLTEQLRENDNLLILHTLQLQTARKYVEGLQDRGDFLRKALSEGSFESVKIPSTTNLD